LSSTFFKVSEKVQNCPFYVGAQFIEPDDNGFDKDTVEKPLTGSPDRSGQKLWVRDDPEYLF
jgi:hypothetical protein